MDNESDKNACNSSSCENLKSRVLGLAKEINFASQTGDEEESFHLSCLILDIFREHEDILPTLKYGAIDAKGDIVYIREFPIEFPTIVERDNKGIIRYSVDEEKLKAILSNNNVCDYIVIFSPWNESPLFKIKISDDFIFYLTAE